MSRFFFPSEHCISNNYDKHIRIMFIGGVCWWTVCMGNANIYSICRQLPLVSPPPPLVYLFCVHSDMTSSESFSKLTITAKEYRFLGEQPLHPLSYQKVSVSWTLQEVERSATGSASMSVVMTWYLIPPL